MDTKTCENVLRKLMVFCKHPDDGVDFKLSELEIIFNLPSNKVQSAFSVLEQQGFIKITPYMGSFFISIQPSAFGYDEMKKEQEQIEHSKRNWDWVQTGVGFILGVITVIISALVTQYFK